jgi:hypothetical protein
MSNTAQAAVKNAIEFYANSLGVSVTEAVKLYKNHESTQQCIQLLVLAQANPEKLRAMAAAPSR